VLLAELREWDRRSGSDPKKRAESVQALVAATADKGAGHRRSVKRSQAGRSGCFGTYECVGGDTDEESRAACASANSVWLSLDDEDSGPQAKRRQLQSFSASTRGSPMFILVSMSASLNDIGSGSNPDTCLRQFRSWDSTATGTSMPSKFGKQRGIEVAMRFPNVYVLFSS